jgi:hypothetical protein
VNCLIEKKFVGSSEIILPLARAGNCELKKNACCNMAYFCLDQGPAKCSPQAKSACFYKECLYWSTVMPTHLHSTDGSLCWAVLLRSSSWWRQLCWEFELYSKYNRISLKVFTLESDMSDLIWKSHQSLAAVRRVRSTEEAQDLSALCTWTRAQHVCGTEQVQVLWCSCHRRNELSLLCAP